MSTHTHVPPVPEAAPEPAPSSLLEAILDNLSAWTVVAAAIGLLYLVWATLEVLHRYVGGVPAVTP
jgi:hypothetical protein